MAEIRWTLTAADDVRILEEWIARDSPLNAVDFTDRLIGSVEKLAASPLLDKDNGCAMVIDLLEEMETGPFA